VVSAFQRHRDCFAGFGIGAPKNTPSEFIEKLNREINAGLADPKIKTRLEDLGGLPMPMTSTEFGQHQAAEKEALRVCSGRWRSALEDRRRVFRNIPDFFCLDLPTTQLISRRLVAGADAAN
jgi:hypothetical protein